MPLNARISRSLAQDLSGYTSNMMSLFQIYKCKNRFEKIKLKEYFDIEYSFDLEVCYSLANIKKVRKVKLKILENSSKDSTFLKYVMSHSIDVSVTQVLEHKLSYEISKSIDREIMNGLRNLQSSQDLH